MTCQFCRTCDHPVCLDCISSKHNKHNFETVEKILPEKLNELKGAEARYCYLISEGIGLKSDFLSNSISFCLS
jgi:hypothetical protein